MFGEILSKRVIQVGIVFFIGINVVAQLYLYHQRRLRDAAIEETKQAVAALAENREKTTQLLPELPSFTEPGVQAEDTTIIVEETDEVPAFDLDPVVSTRATTNSTNIASNSTAISTNVSALLRNTSAIGANRRLIAQQAPHRLKIGSNKTDAPEMRSEGIRASFLNFFIVKQQKIEALVRLEVSV